MRWRVREEDCFSEAESSPLYWKKAHAHQGPVLFEKNRVRAEKEKGKRWLFRAKTVMNRGRVTYG